MHGFVIESEPLLKSGVDTVEGMGDGCIAIKKLVPDPAEESFHFAATARFTGWSMDEMDTKGGADYF